MARILCPPSPLNSDGTPMIFLAGSIEMGGAEPWQGWMCNELEGLAVTILNPRRDDWDSSWCQEQDDPVFREQVEWELEGLERANLVALYLSPGTRSPISLLELGLCARKEGLVVCCPSGFWRKGNVDILCQRHRIPMVPHLEGLRDHLLREGASLPSDPA